MEANTNVSVNGFSFNLAKRMLTPNRNFFCSPLSVAAVLGMAAGGADGDTLHQILDALGMTEESELLTFAHDLAAINGNLSKVLSVANMICVKNGLKVNPDYRELITSDFQASCEQQPFDTTTVDFINDWVKKNTGGMIDRLVDEGAIRSSLMVLLNAIYFHAKWESEFNLAQPKPFRINGGNFQDVPTLSKAVEDVRYAETNLGQVIELPYKDTSICMYVVLPREDTTPEAVLEVLGDSWQTIENDLTIQDKVVFQMPKWTHEMSFTGELKDALQALGVIDLFGRAADLHHIAPGLYASDIIQKSKIEVDEQGTKAAAATRMFLTCAAVRNPVPPKEMIVDRPFIYLIADSTTKNVLFIGVNNDPSKQQ